MELISSSQQSRKTDASRKSTVKAQVNAAIAENFDPTL